MNYYFIPNKKEIDNIENIILPLKDYSIGFDNYFDVEEINLISEKKEVSIIINTFLHKDKINNIKSIIDKLNNIKYFFIEDLGLINIIPKEKIVILQNHIINNYESINYFNNLGIKNIVISNELTIEEIEEIKNKASSNLFYFLINRNMLMYSKRKLISSYYDYKNISGSLNKIIKENISNKELIIKEENDGTVIFDKNIFSANKYLDKLSGINLIINFNNMSDEEIKIIKEHYLDNNLSDYINVDNYFLDNKIGYKVGEIK